MIFLLSKIKYSLNDLNIVYKVWNFSKSFALVIEHAKFLPKCLANWVVKVLRSERYSTLTAHLAWADFKIKVKQIAHSTVHLENFHFSNFQHPASHYGRFGVRLFIIRQNMNSGFWKKILAQIVAEYMYFHMVYHTFI